MGNRENATAASFEVGGVSSWVRGGRRDFFLVVVPWLTQRGISTSGMMFRGGCFFDVSMM